MQVTIMTSNSPRPLQTDILPAPALYYCSLLLVCLLSFNSQLPPFYYPTLLLYYVEFMIDKDIRILLSRYVCITRKGVL